MPAKVAVLFSVLLTLIAGENSINDTRGAINDIAQELLAANEKIAQALAAAITNIENDQENALDLADDARAEAGNFLSQAKVDVHIKLLRLQEKIDPDGGHVLQCFFDQLDNLLDVYTDAAHQVINGVASNVNDVWDSLKPVVADLRGPNQALNALENELSECEAAEDRNACALDVLGRIAESAIEIPASIDGSVGGVTEGLKAAARIIAEDTTGALEGLGAANSRISDDIVNCILG